MILFALLAGYGISVLTTWLLGGPPLGVLRFLADTRWNPGEAGWIGLGVGFVCFLALEYLVEAWDG
jgi:hypothetical protein